MTTIAADHHQINFNRYNNTITKQLTDQDQDFETELKPADISTTQLLDIETVNVRLIEKVTGLKDWMVQFQKTMPPLPVDTYSNANPELAVTKHLIWDVKHVDFDKKVLSAVATYAYRNKKPTSENVIGNDKLILDVKNLNIASIKIDGKDVAFEIIPNPDQQNPNKCDALQITIPPKKSHGNVVIEYSTNPKASGIFWIDPKFTSGKNHPLLYTLFQANEGASVIPGQHSPQVRLTWEVNVATGSPELMALSSVKNNPKTTSPDGMYRGLKMDRKIPLYLLCLEISHMAFVQYLDNNGDPTNCGVYAEPESLLETAKAFADMPKYIKAAEKIFGPYKWGRYDASVLCNAFPCFAMEHACKSTFGKVCLGTPEVIAHEITHSWLGNDITNATWLEFYLNEGFTVFGEVMIMAEMFGWDMASLIMIETLDEMEKAIEEFKETRPGVLPLVSTDFEYTRIPYGKGALFFFMLQSAIGHQEFNQFIKDYMNVFYENSMSTERFLKFLQEWLKNEKNIEDFDSFKNEHKIDEWLYGIEIPDNRPIFTSKYLNEIKQEAENVLSNQPLDMQRYNNWTEQMKSLFLNELEKHIVSEQLALLEEQLNISNNSSLVLRNSWAQVCATCGYYTPKTKQFIIDFVLERNSQLLSNSISLGLIKTKEGLEIAKEIIVEGKKRDCIFEITRRVIEDNIKKSKFD